MRLYRSRSSYGKTTSEARQTAVSHRQTWRGFEDVTRRRRTLAALLIFCTLFIGVVPVLLGRVVRGAMPGGEAVVRVIATLDGKPWSGILEFKLSGSEQWLGSIVPYEIHLRPGVYGIHIAAGGPHNSTLRDVTPTGSRYVGAGQTITFIVAFDGGEGT